MDGERGLRGLGVGDGREVGAEDGAARMTSAIIGLVLIGGAYVLMIGEPTLSPVFDNDERRWARWTLLAAIPVGMGFVIGGTNG